MKLKDAKPKYETLEVIEDREDFGLFPVPQLLDRDIAIERFGERKVLFMIDHDDIRHTEVIIENYRQFTARNNFNLKNL